MGLVHADIMIKNPRLADDSEFKVRMLVDSGALHLCITKRMQKELGLEKKGTKDVTLADGSSRRVPYVGPVELRFKNRVGFTGALVMGNAPLLGAIPMEDMDLVILPKKRRLDVNPKNPKIAGSIAKGMSGGWRLR